MEESCAHSLYAIVIMRPHCFGPNAPFDRLFGSCVNCPNNNAMTHPFTNTICAVALASILGLAGCTSSVPEVFKIGVAVPLSGPTAARGQDLLNGALLAAEELNAKGVTVKGKRVTIEIVAKDDKTDPEVTKQVANELLSEQVHAVIGHVYTPQSAVAVPIYASKGIPQLLTSTSATLLGLGAGNVFRLVAHDGIQARALAAYATENLGGRRIVALVETSEYGKGLYAGISEALKGKPSLVLKVDIKIGDPVSDEQAAQIVAAKPDVVIAAAPREVQAISLMTKLQSLGYTNYSLLGANGIKTPTFAKTTSAINGIFATATTIDCSESDMGAKFVERFKTKFKAGPVWGAHYAYDAVYVLTDTMARTGSAAAPDLVAGLKKFEANAPVNQHMRFADSGEQRYPDVGVYKADGGIWVPQVRSSAW